MSIAHDNGTVVESCPSVNYSTVAVVGVGEGDVSGRLTKLFKMDTNVESIYSADVLFFFFSFLLEASYLEQLPASRFLAPSFLPSRHNVGDGR